jgi:hypothetical protein
MLRLFDEYKIRASFIISLGPDHSTHPLKGILPEGVLLRLPASRIGRKARDTLLALADAGHELGISAFTPSIWRKGVAFRSEQWTRKEVMSAAEAFQELFGSPARLYAARDWQLNPHLLQLEEKLGFHYASDVRGRGVFFPVMGGAHFRCPQISTTLPTLDELMVSEGVGVDKVHEYLFAACQRVLPCGEVFSLTAEREGMELLPVLERMIVMWRGSQGEVMALQELFGTLDPDGIPSHQVGWSEPPGQSRHVAMQALPFDDGRNQR